MDNINKTVAKNLKKLRGDKDFSLDKLAKLSGVSKSMLGQIERGETNPTLSILWKIAGGMKISFSQLLKHEEKEAIIIKKEDAIGLVIDEGRYRIYNIFPYDEKTQSEIYRIEIDVEGHLDADPHSKGTLETLTVFKGTLGIIIDEKEYIIEKHSSIKFRADCSHTYVNKGNDLVEVSMIIQYDNI